MSMLAERKRKQRWSLNPRGKLFLEDKNNFGYKMLQKMGWKHGKGLGVNEDGIPESLRLNFKTDLKGMGYKEKEACAEHDSNFSSLLKNLNGNNEKTSEDIKVTSLEKKSEKSRARIHYHKFTKGKDLSRYSQKDLANIFGKKTLSQNDIQCEIEEPKEDMKCISDNLINKGSMTDYFQKKFETFSQNIENNENSPKKIKENSKKAKNCEFVEQNEIESSKLEENIYEEPKIKRKKEKQTKIDIEVGIKRGFRNHYLKNSWNNNNGFNSNNENIHEIGEKCNGGTNIENVNVNNPETNQIQDGLVGDVGTQLHHNIKVNDGSKLCFKDMRFKSGVPHYVQNYVSRAKKSYRHLIRGDITVAFKNANLHDIKGYAIKASSKIRK